MIILKDLEPYRHRTLEQVEALVDKGIAKPEEVLLKSDFMGFVRRFERENDNILEFGSAISYDTKISTIYNTLLNYAKERAARI